MITEGKVKVLLVDDNTLALRSMSRALQLGGVNNIALSDPYEALECYSQSLDMILMTDYRMPQMNGLDLITQIRELNNDARCIIYTGFPDDIDQKEIARAGVKFFSKPLNIETLIEYITNNSKKEEKDV